MNISPLMRPVKFTEEVLYDWKTCYLLEPLSNPAVSHFFPHFFNKTPAGTSLTLWIRDVLPSSSLFIALTA
jgi:hypothetical protein